MEIRKTNRGFEIIEFEDYNGEKCSLQQSSLALYDQPGTSAIWFGIQDNRMHLSLDQTIELLSHLQNWIQDGTFENKDKDCIICEEAKSQLPHSAVPKPPPCPRCARLDRDKITDIIEDCKNRGKDSYFAAGKILDYIREGR